MNNITSTKSEIQLQIFEDNDKKQLNFSEFLNENINKLEDIAGNHLKNNKNEITTALEDAVKISIPMNDEFKEKSIIDEKIDSLREIYIFNNKLKVLIKNKNEILLLKKEKKFDELARKYDIESGKTDALSEKHNLKITEMRNGLIVNYQKILDAMKISIEELKTRNDKNSNIDINLINNVLESLEANNRKYKEKIIKLLIDIEICKLNLKITMI
ncbi:MAG: hypothetical protein H0V82_03825 [Candidatus Protochlamydia sp.]|nr:hypothetical protein [Candidatus Protochlamydia sp.]